MQNHTFVNYIGNYDYYLEKNEELTKIYAASKDNESDKKSITATSSDAQPDTTASSDNGKLSWQQQKELQAKRRKIENEYKKTEERIAQCEDIISGVDEELMKPEVGTQLCENVMNCQKKEAMQKKNFLHFTKNGNNLQKSSKNLINCNRKTATLQMVRTELLQISKSNTAIKIMNK